jgi:indole-3-glycerol phosphate synthase
MRTVDVIIVGASLAAAAAAKRLVDAGYDALLVGESLVTSGDHSAAVEALRAAVA